MVRRVLRLFSPGRIVLALSLVVIVYLLFSAGGSALDYYRLTDDEDRLQQQVAGLRAQSRALPPALNSK